MMVNSYSMWDYRSECWNMTNRMITLGNGFEEVQLQMLLTERYPFFKNEMKKWMNMLDGLAESDMTFDGILKNTFNKAFAKGGLFDSWMSYMKKETEYSLEYANKHQVWDMNLKKPSGFSYSKIDKFVTPSGVSDELATLNWCKPANSKNATVEDINSDLDYFTTYEKMLVNDTVNNDTTTMFDKIMKLVNNEEKRMDKLIENGTDPFDDDLHKNTTRVLSTHRIASGKTVIMKMSYTGKTLKVGDDNQLNETVELADVTAIPQEKPTAWLA